MKKFLYAIFAICIFSTIAYAANLTTNQRDAIKYAIPNAEVADRLGDSLDDANAGVGAITFSVAAEASNAIVISGQMNDIRGTALAVRGTTTCFSSSDSAGDALVKVGVAFQAPAVGDGIVALVGTSSVFVMSEADGDFDLEIQDTANVSHYVCCSLPNGARSCSAVVDFN